MLTAENLDRASGLDQCAQEPIHVIGHIQPHGMLFALWSRISSFAKSAPMYPLSLGHLRKPCSAAHSKPSWERSSSRYFEPAH